MKINHFGFLTKDINKSLIQFKILGFKQISEITKDTLRGVDILFISSSDTLIELVAPNCDDSVVKSLVKKQSNSIYHICYEVDNLIEKIKELEKEGFILIDSPKPAPAFNNRLVAFMLSKSAGLIELLEVNK